MITASDAREMAFERPVGESTRSVFTELLVEGLSTGAADQDGDGQVSGTDLFEYVCDAIKDVRPKQTPCFSGVDMHGDICIAWSPQGPKPAASPTDHMFARPHLKGAQFRRAWVLDMIARTIAVVEDIGAQHIHVQLQAMRAQIDGRSTTVGVIGGFSTGKSSLINAMLRMQLLPRSMFPSTGVVTTVTYGDRPGATLHYKDPLRPPHDIDPDGLAPYVLLDSDLSGQLAYVEVRAPIALCSDGVEIIDTPGFDVAPPATRIVTEIVPRADAIVLCIQAHIPFRAPRQNFWPTSVPGRPARSSSSSTRSTSLIPTISTACGIASASG